MDPLQDFLAEKRAATQLNFPFARGGVADAVSRHGAQIPEMFGKALAGAGATAAVGATVAGASVGARMLFDAATKGRDFRKMMEYNPDLVSEHERDPKTFNQLFSSLRSVNRAFSADPIIAGTYMRRMVGSPTAGGVLTDAVGMRGDVPPSFGETLQRHVLGGSKKEK
jgi:hypothetical protein